MKEKIKSTQKRKEKCRFSDLTQLFSSRMKGEEIGNLPDFPGKVFACRIGEPALPFKPPE